MNKTLEEFQKGLNEYKEEEVYRLRKEAVKDWYNRHSHFGIIFCAVQICQQHPAVKNRS